ncbi:MAG: hypothetical protein QNJ31_01440 [Candidatus Caenarcaniphilales bacterium]|nr:hypothetical protein [Candidatus Caenarcaniphilales bacterium]
MLTLFKRLVFCLAILTFIGTTQDAQAIRFGLNSGFYNEKVNVPCAGSREFGLRLGFYFDKTANDIIYASAIRGINLCKIGGGCAQTQHAQMEPVGCAPAPVGCTPAPVCSSCVKGTVETHHTATATPAVFPSSATPIQQIFAYPPGGNFQAAPAVASAPKTEVYLLVLPDQAKRQVRYQQQTAYQAAPQYEPEYYSEPVEYTSQAPVRGMW